MSDLLALPSEGWPRVVCDAAWQTTAIALMACMALRLALRGREEFPRPAVVAWLALLGMASCVSVVPLSVAVRCTGHGLLPPRISLPKPPSRDARGGHVEPKVYHPASSSQRALVDSVPNASSHALGASIGVAPTVAAEKVVRVGRVHARGWWWSVVAVGWVAASVLLLLRFSYSVLTLQRLCRSATACSDTEILRAAGTAVDRLGLSANIRIYASALVSSPMVLALGRHPRVFLPAAATGALPHPSAGTHHREWFTTLCHELAHIRRHDGWGRVFAELVVVLLPWQPLLWLLRRRYYEACEKACDDWVVVAGGDPLALAEILTKWARHSAIALTQGAAGTSLRFRERIERLLARRDYPRPNLGHRWLFGGAVLTALMLVTVAMSQSARWQWSKLVEAMSRDEVPLRMTATGALGQIARTDRRALVAVTAALHDEHPWVRQSAAVALEQLGPEAVSAVKVLRAAALRDEDPQTRLHAAFALWRIKHDARPMVSVLIEGLQGSGDRAEAAMVLGEIGPEAQAAIPALIEASGDGNDLVRRASIAALARMGRRAIPFLTAALEHPDHRVRAGAAEALGAFGRGAEPAAEALKARRHDANALVRVSAAAALWRVRPPAVDTLTVLTEALRRAPEARRAAIRALGDMGPAAADAVPAIIQLARQPEGVELRGEVVVALGRIGRPAVPHLVEILVARPLQSEHSWSAWALSRMGTEAEEALPALIAAVQTGSPSVALPAAVALGGIGPAAKPAVPALEKALENPEPFVQVRAAEALWKIERRKAIPVLVAALDTDIPGTALSLLVRMGPDIVPPLVELLGSPKEHLRILAARGLGNLGADGRDAFPSLVQALHDRSPAVRQSVAGALSAIDARRALPHLIGSLNDPKAQVRQMGCIMLGSIGLPAAAALPALRRRLNDDDAGVRGAARRALIDAGPDGRVALMAFLDSLDVDSSLFRESIGALCFLPPTVDRAGSERRDRNDESRGRGNAEQWAPHAVAIR